MAVPFLVHPILSPSKMAVPFLVSGQHQQSQGHRYATVIMDAERTRVLLKRHRDIHLGLLYIKTVPTLCSG